MNENEKRVLLTALGCVCHITKLIIEEDMMESSSDEDTVGESEIPVQVRVSSEILCKITLFNEQPDLVYRSHFRITKGSTEILCKLLGAEWNQNRMGRRSLDVQAGIMLSLWYLATKETFREVGDRFGVTRGHAYRILNKFTTQLTGHITKFIKWPAREDMFDVVNDFNRVRGNTSFPGVVGCVDGTHIQIPQPEVDAVSFYCRKGYHSVILQAVCTSKLYFTDIYVGWPGSVNDARVWRNSPLYQKLVENLDSLLPNTHLVGDKAYPLDNFLMVPFKDNGHLTESQRKFNTILSRTRILIEQAFGHVKNAFRCLQYLNRIKMENVKNVIMSACILHNIRVAENIPFENIQIPIDAEDEVGLLDLQNNHVAQLKRNHIVNIIQNM